MSELINTNTASHDIRWQLLASVAACSLLAAITITPVSAADEDRPTVWIELGGQLQRLQNSEELFRPFTLQIQPRPNYELISPDTVQRAPRYQISGEGKISLTPHGTDWALSAAIRYGRTNGDKHLHQQTTEVRESGKVIIGDDPVLVQLSRFGDAKSKRKQSHLIADFMVGRDVGLGLWGDQGSSTVDFGVRIAQFTSKTTTVMSSLPEMFIQRVPKPYPGLPNLHVYRTYGHHHSNFAELNSQRSFRGIGPSLSWEGSAPIAGDPDEGAVGFDWGVNGALLFGRQKVNGSYATMSRYFMGPKLAAPPPPTKTTRDGGVLDRSHSRIVPNLGGFAGVSFRYPNARVSFGYRADFFFGAMDGGIAKRTSENTSFHGPFAKVSIGLGG